MIDGDANTNLKVNEDIQLEV